MGVAEFIVLENDRSWAITLRLIEYPRDKNGAGGNNLVVMYSNNAVES
jgi:hypothetical protein